MTETIQVICSTCHGTGYLWNYKDQTFTSCITCVGTGGLFKSQIDVLNESNAALTTERDRAILIIKAMLLELKGNKDLYNCYTDVLADLANDIYEREHPDVEVPW